MSVDTIAQTARSRASQIAVASTESKNAALTAMAARLNDRRSDVLAANEADLVAAGNSGVSPHLIDRLRFGPAKLDARIRSLDKIAALPDPVGRILRSDRMSNGLQVSRIAVPLGVILMIYEARPHVTINAGAFCIKSGNAAILRGGSEAARCNALLGELWQQSLADAGLPADAVQVIGGSHEDVDSLLQRSDCIDLVIPRGGRGLIESVARTSRIAVVKHFAGVCHVFLDAAADVDAGIDIAVDSKCLMPEVCNAMETLLVSEALTTDLPRIVKALQQQGVTVRGCPKTQAAVAGIEAADEGDWTTEYLDMVVSVRVVAGVDEAIAHINTYGSHHTDAIVTADDDAAAAFTARVDSAVVLVNASTMFCDGESLGMGAEIGISTDKLHARGPMGLEELTSYKFVIRGDGAVMGDRISTAAGPDAEGKLTT